MSATPDFTTVAKAQFEAFAQLTEAVINGAQRAIDLNVKTARTAFADSTEALKALAAVKEPAELQSLAAKFAQPKVEVANAYARELYDTTTKAQSEVVRVIESQVAELQKNAESAFEAFKKNAPAGTETFAAFARSAWENATQAYETLTKNVRDAAATFDTTLTPAPAVSKKRR